MRALAFAAGKICLFLVLCSVLGAYGQNPSAYQQTNLVSDGSVVAQHTDPTLINPWGIAIGQATPFWVNSQGGGVSEVYDSAGNKQFDVGIPGKTGSTATGHPTGIVFNASNTAFVLSNGIAATFLFSTTDGTIAGWNANLTNALGVVDNSASGAVYTGLAMVSPGPVLLAANFARGTVDAFDNKFAATKLAGSFADPGLPTGYAPYGIHVINNHIFIDYALQRPGGGPPMEGAGNGVVDVFDLNGNFLKRVGSGGVLNAPWAAVLAPSGFGSLAGALLIGNFGDGIINAFDATTFASKGPIQDANGNPIANPGLWDMVFGSNGVGDPNTLYFSAGLNSEKDGLFGAISLASTGAPGGDFSLTTSPNSLSIVAGQTASASVNVTPLMGFNSSVSFTCSGMPPGTSCAFSPATVTPSGGVMASTTLTVSTTLSTPAGTYGWRQPPKWAPWSLSGGFAALVIGGGFLTVKPRRSRRRLRALLRCLAVSLVVFAIVLLIACAGTSGSASSNTSTPAGAGEMTITATSGAISHSVGIALTVH